ncbi:hypothetical protein HFP89_11520 [Wenzhouxiangella sp. XN79A]|uniref:DUF11 domain-containing protein n=1 Tax=Wenzhouxiangella sp. XN79A TaxID=2724193 RepID=UPI00144A8B3C|nr:DUF11 domain-containing protein [Wenzhouxiangella sp. XN79A]NKI35791.1 hypothetical protein [Wenzhouxiangella sp. XN79A]
MNRLLSLGVVLGGLLSVPAHGQVQLSVDGQPAIETESPINSIVYRPSARRLEVQTAWDDLRCVPNPDGPAVTLPIPQPGDFVFALDQLPGDVDGEYVVEADGSIMQLGAAISGDPVTLSIVTSDARINDCNGPDCAVLVCAPGGTPIFSGDFEPIAADLGVSWDTVPGGGALDLVAGGAGTTLALRAANTGQLDATSVTVDLDVLLPGSGSIGCPSVVSGGAGFAFDANCSGTWSIGDLNAGAQVEMQLLFTADAAATIGELATADAVIDSPTVADINPADNAAGADLDVIKQAALEFTIVSFPQSQIDLTAGPAAVNFSVLASPQGPSTLNSVVDIALQYPSGSGVTLIESDNDFLPPTWSPLIGSLDEELLFEFSIDSFEPGVDAFCVDLVSVDGVPGAQVSIAGSSITQRCLDVIGPETVDLTVASTSDAGVVAGSAPGGNPGNAFQQFTLTNNNTTFDADNIDADIVLSLPVDVTVTPAVSLGTLVQDGTDPNLWAWSIATLPAGQSATASLWYDVGPSAPDGELVQADFGNVTVDPGQVLVDPLVGDQAQTTVDREIDLRVTSLELPDPVAPGGTLIYEFQLVNLGPSDASVIDLDLATVLPADVTLGSVTSNLLGSYTAGVWSVASLQADSPGAAVLTVPIDVGSGAVPGSDVISGTVTVTNSSETRINTGDDSSTQTTSIQ